MRADGIFSVRAQVTWQREADQRVGDDETVSGKRTHPPVNIQSTGAPRRKRHDGNDRGNSGDEECPAWGFVAAMGCAQAIMRKAIVGHEQQHACGSGNASQCRGEHAD